MRPALDQSTAPGTAPGAVPSHPHRRQHPTAAPVLRERDVWRAVAANLLATLRPWSR